MRKLLGVVLAVLVVASASGTATAAAVTPESTPADRALPTAGDGTPAVSAAPAETTPHNDSHARPDPEEDVLGWEGGYWHNETIGVNNLDGLNESEQEAVVNRAIARVEYVREKEFRVEVPVEVITREQFRNRQSTDYTDTFRTFDNVKFEALLFVGEDEDSLVVQNENRGSNVLGYYSPKNDSIVLISDTGQPQFDGEGTLGHELVHALQDQYFNLTSIRAQTRDGYNAQNGIIEGEANFVQRRYTSRCGAEWECIESPEGGSPDTSNLHFGIYFMNFFPYSDGPGLVARLYNQGGWDAVDRAYENIPRTSTQVIYPDQYTDGSDATTTVELSDSLSDGWERVRPEPQRPGSVRADYASVGQAALTSMFVYTYYESSFNGSQLLGPRDFLNIDGGQVNSSDPINYDIAYTNGFRGDRMHIYRNADAGANESAYVWRTVWESPAEAREFARGYRALLSYWGGSQIGDGVWRIPEDSGSPFADAFYLHVDGDTVTMVNAPTTDDLSDVYDGVPEVSTATPTPTPGPTTGPTTTMPPEDEDTDTPMPTPTPTAGDGGDGSADTTTDTSGPGFGAVAALLAVLAAALLARRRA